MPLSDALPLLLVMELAVRRCLPSWSAKSHGTRRQVGGWAFQPLRLRRPGAALSGGHWSSWLWCRQAVRQRVARGGRHVHAQLPARSAGALSARMWMLSMLLPHGR